MEPNIKPEKNQEALSIKDELGKTSLELAVETKQITTIKPMLDTTNPRKNKKPFSAETGDCYDLNSTEPAVLVAYEADFHPAKAKMLLSALQVFGFHPIILEDFTKESLETALTSSIKKPPPAIMLFIITPIYGYGNFDAKNRIENSIEDTMRHLDNLPGTPKVLVIDTIKHPYYNPIIYREERITCNWLIAFVSISKFAKQLTDAAGCEDLYSMLQRSGSDYHGHPLIISTMRRRLLLRGNFAKTAAYTQEKTLEDALSSVSEKEAPYDCYDLKVTQPAVIVAFTTNNHAKDAKIMLDALKVYGFHLTVLEDFTEERLEEALKSSVEKSPSAIMLFMCCYFDGYRFHDGAGQRRTHIYDIMWQLAELPNTPKVLVSQGVRFPYDYFMNWLGPTRSWNWLIAFSSFPEFAKQLTNNTGSEDLYDMLQRSCSDFLKRDEYCVHIITSTMNKRLLLGRSFAETEVHESSAVWSELYKTVDFDELAKAFLCQQDSADAAAEKREHHQPPATNEVMTASSTWSSLYRAVDFEELAEAFSGFNTCPGKIQELPRDTGGNSDASKDDVSKSGQPPAESCGSDLAPNGKSGGTDQNQEADGDKDKKSSLETKNDTAVNLQSRRAFTVGPCSHSTDSMEYDVLFCASNTAGACANKRRESGNWMQISADKSSISTSMRLTNAVSYVEMVLCMPHYQMVWMNVLDEHFVLINAAISDYKNAKLKSEHIRNVLETLLKKLQRKANIIMSYDEKVDFPKDDSIPGTSQNWDRTVSDGTENKKRWLGFKARGTKTAPSDKTERYFLFEIEQTREPQCTSERVADNATNGKLRATTWNVCGIETDFWDARIEKILKTPEVIDSEIIFFQEFPPRMVHEFSCNHEAYSKVFGWRALETGKFIYNASLIRRGSEQRSHFKEVRLENKILKCEIVMDRRNWVAMNCHLQSNRQGTKDENIRLRTSSFDSMQNLAGKAAYILIGGDMNMFDDEESASKLTDATDVWLLAKNIRGEYIHTWDPMNSFRGHILDRAGNRDGDGELVQSRFDRFYLQPDCLQIDGYRHLGTEKVELGFRNTTKLHVSDHYGVWTEIRI